VLVDPTFFCLLSLLGGISNFFLCCISFSLAGDAGQAVLLLVVRIYFFVTCHIL
jgi:hypothetical protein